MPTVKRPRRICLLTLPSLVILVVGAWFWNPASRPVPTHAQSSDTPVVPTVPAWETESVRLNYLSVPWSKVLAHVAEQSGSSIVMDQAPVGKYTRYDRQYYTRTEAVRILNRELESSGFRILEKGSHLVVLHLDSLRSKYTRPVVHSGDREREAQRPTEADANAGQQPRWTERRFDTIRPADRSNVSENALQRREPVRRVGYADEPGKDSVIPIRTRNHTATSLARKVYSAFKDRAELINEGPEGLPAFRVYSPADSESGKRRVQFTVGIDTEWNHLVVQAPKASAESVTQLIRRLDSTVTRKGEVMELTATTKDADKVAKRLRPVVAQLVAHSAGQPDREPPPPPPKPQEGEPPQQPDVPSIVRGLKSNVVVESMPDLGVLILTGNEEDVEEVLKVIRQLEQLAIGTTPHLHLRTLEFVHNETLAELLTSVYDRLTQPPQGTTSTPLTMTQNIAFFAVGKPNAILILASDRELPAILELIDKLDTPVDPQHEFAVFKLKHAVAAQVSTMITDFYEERPGLGTRVQVVVDVRSNSIVVHGRPRDLDEVAALIRKLDRDDPGSVSQMKIIVLKNAVAEELAIVINNAIQSVLSAAPQVRQTGAGVGAGAGAAGQVSQELRDVKSAALQFLIQEGDGEREIRSGILSDIRITADARTNSLVVTAPEASMQLMVELIEELDKPTDTVAEIKVFTLGNADANAVAALLQELLVEDEQQEGQMGIQLAGAEDASSGLIPLRFSVDTRSNSILAVGGAEALRVVEAIVLRLDESDIRRRENLVYRLKNAPVTEVADAINQFLESQRELETADPELVSTFEQIEREVIVVPEPVSNSLLISATKRYFEEIKNLVIQLDEAPPQVIIQALLVEVQLDDTDEFGIELGIQDSVLFNRSVVGDLVTLTETVSDPGTGIQTTTQRVLSSTGVPGFPFNNQPLGNNISANPGKVGTQGLSNFGLGRVNGDLGFGGLVVSASSDSVNVLMRALAQNRRVEVLSRPQIRTVDNQLAQIQVGQQVPIVSGVNITAQGAANPNVIQDQAGIILTVTPRISPDGLIVMETVAEKSAFTGAGVPIFTDAVTGNIVESPIKDITTARTTVAVPNGQTIVMGGMILNDDQETHRKVPWLGDIPLLGAGFRFDSRTTARTELLIFLTPRIIQDDMDNEIIKQIEAERIHYSERQAEQMHGPIFAVPPTSPAQDIEGDDSETMPLPPAVPSEDGVPTSVMPQLRPVPATSSKEYEGGFQPAGFERLPAKKKPWRLPRLWPLKRSK